jgi:L-ascorbate metabolism protein UlaG (beta-lactamase superfamily)
MIEVVEWLGHASFRINSTPLIYIDPWRIVRPKQPADVILISHDHYDHCSPADIEKLRGADTVVIGNQMVANLIENVTVLRPWQVINIERGGGRVSIKAVPAYNAHHPKEFDGLGFIISQNFHDLYFAGDTDCIPEMERIRPDIAILPVGGRQTMTASQAAQAVQRLRPRYAIPSHWGSAAEGGTQVDVKIFIDEVGTAAEVIRLDQQR